MPFRVWENQDIVDVLAVVGLGYILGIMVLEWDWVLLVAAEPGGDGGGCPVDVMKKRKEQVNGFD